MADDVSHFKISPFVSTLYVSLEILLAISPTLIFLFGCSTLIGKFIGRLIGSPGGTSILEVIITGSIVIQLMKVWGLVVTSVELLAEFICPKLLDECEAFTANSLAFQEACLVFEPRISCFLVCAAMSLIPWSMLMAWNAIDQQRLYQELIAWIRFSRWNRTEMGMSIYFLVNPIENEDIQRELAGRRIVRGRRRSKERKHRNLTRSMSCQQIPVANNVRLKASQSI